VGGANQRDAGLNVAQKIKANIFEGMREAMQDALAYERGETVDLRVTRLPCGPKPVSPNEIRRIRKSLNASQAVFASHLDSSANTQFPHALLTA
jgi:DNA-binding transcriptional regulator YiaG